MSKTTGMKVLRASASTTGTGIGAMLIGNIGIAGGFGALAIPLAPIGMLLTGVGLLIPFSAVLTKSLKKSKRSNRKIKPTTCTQHVDSSSLTARPNKNTVVYKDWDEVKGLRKGYL